MSGQALSRIFKQNMVRVDEASVQGIQANWDLYIRSAPINSQDPLRRPLFWPKYTLKGRSEAWGYRSKTTTRRSDLSSIFSGTATADGSSDASSSVPSVPSGLKELPGPIRRPPGLPA